MNYRGFTLVSTMIAALVGSIVIAALGSQFVLHSKQVGRLSQRIETLDLKYLLMMTLANPEVCACQLNASSSINPNGRDKDNLRFNSGRANQTINFTKLYSGCGSAASPLVQTNRAIDAASSLGIKDIRLTDISSVGATNQYTGKWEITFRSMRGDTVVPAPIKFYQGFNIDSSSPESSRSIASCGVPGPSADDNILPEEPVIPIPKGPLEPQTFLVESNKDNEQSVTSNKDYCAMSRVHSGGFNSDCKLEYISKQWVLTATDPKGSGEKHNGTQRCEMICF